MSIERKKIQLSREIIVQTKYIKQKQIFISNKTLIWLIMQPSKTIRGIILMMIY